MAKRAFDYRHLSLEERLKLVGEIWDSIAEEANARPDALPLTEAQKAELDRRLADFEQNPDSGIPMDEALERIRSRLHKR